MNQGQSAKTGYIRSMVRRLQTDDPEILSKHAQMARANTSSYFKNNLIERLELATSDGNKTWDEKGTSALQSHLNKEKSVADHQNQIANKKDKWY